MSETNIDDTPSVYTKHAEQSEYDMHQLAYDAGINAPRIVVWDPINEKLTTELIQGLDVIGFIRRGYTRRSVVTVCTNLIRQLEKLHQLGYMHGDVSISNTIITFQDEVYLIDFEFTRRLDASKANEMMKLVKLLTILLSSLPLLVSRLMLLCEETSNIHLPFALRRDVTYDMLVETISR